MNTKNLQRTLQYYRQEKGYSIKEVALLVDVSEIEVQKWETGEMIPTTEVLYSLGKIYGKSMMELLEEDKSEEVNNINVFSGLLSIIGFFAMLSAFIHISETRGNNFNLFYLDFGSEVVVHLALISVTLYLLVLTILYISNFLIDEFKYHRVSMFSIAYLLPFLLIYGIFEDVNSGIGLIYIFGLYLIKYFLHSRRVKILKTELEKEFSLLRYRKTVSSFSVVLNLFVMSVFLMVVPFFDVGPFLFIFLSFILGVSITFPFIKREFFEDRLKISLYSLSSPFFVFVYMLYSSLEFPGSVDMSFYVVLLISFIPVILNNLDKTAYNISQRKGHTYNSFTKVRNFLWNRTTIEYTMVILYLLFFVNMFQPVSGGSINPFSAYDAMTTDAYGREAFNMFHVLYIFIAIQAFEWIIAVFVKRRIVKSLNYRMIMYLIFIMMMTMLIGGFEWVFNYVGLFNMLLLSLILLLLNILLIAYQDESMEEKHETKVGHNIIFVTMIPYFVLMIVMTFHLDEWYDEYNTLFMNLVHLSPYPFFIIYVISSFVFILKKIEDRMFVTILLFLPAAFFLTFTTVLLIMSEMEFDIYLLLFVFIFTAPGLIYNWKYFVKKYR